LPRFERSDDTKSPRRDFVFVIVVTKDRILDLPFSHSSAKPSEKRICARRGISRGVWHSACHIGGVLKITINENSQPVEVKLEGRIAGAWAEELNRVWVEAAPRIGSKQVSIDLSEVTYADAEGKRVLGRIVAQTGATLVTGTLWTQYLAKDVTGTKKN
jgi:hypothetical protein